MTHLNPPDSDDTRVVVIDDDRDAAETLAAALTENGCQVQSAEDGLSALDLIERFQPHCVLLDIQMPGLDGLTLAHRLRERHGNDIVLVAITGGSPADKTVSATFDLVDHWFTKPIDLRKLMKVVRAG